MFAGAAAASRSWTSRAQGAQLQPEGIAHPVALGQPSRRLASAARWRILAYVGTLTVLLGFAAPHGGLIYIPVSFILKNKLQLSAHEIADFRLIAGLPMYLGALF